MTDLADRRLQLAHQTDPLTEDDLTEFARPTMREILHTRNCRRLRWIDPTYLVPIPKSRRDLVSYYDAILDGQRDMFSEPTDAVHYPNPEDSVSSEDFLP